MKNKHAVALGKLGGARSGGKRPGAGRPKAGERAGVRMDGRLTKAAMDLQCK